MSARLLIIAEPEVSARQCGRKTDTRTDLLDMRRNAHIVHHAMTEKSGDWTRQELGVPGLPVLPNSNIQITNIRRERYLNSSDGLTIFLANIARRILDKCVSLTPRYDYV